MFRKIMKVAIRIITIPVKVVFLIVAGVGSLFVLLASMLEEAIDGNE